MKQTWEYTCLVVFGLIVSILLPVSVKADISLSNMQSTNVTPAGFSILWQASETAAPVVRVFSDAPGSTEITTDLEITYYPLMTGNPDLTEEYDQEISKDFLKDSTRSSRLLMAKVHGCLPDTEYFFRIGAFNNSGEQSWLPGTGGTFSVRTMNANDFVMDAKQLIVTFMNNAEDLAADGWIATASLDDTNEETKPVSVIVGDGTGSNQAFIDLSNLFGINAQNWVPGAGSYDIKIELLGDTIIVDPQTFTIEMEEAFHISAVQNILFNTDGGPDSDYDNLIDLLEERADVCSNYLDADTDDDGIPDGEEDLNRNGVVDGNETDPCNPDTDEDGIQDGTEDRKNTPVDDPDGDDPAVGTDIAFFIPDSNPDTGTSPLNPDTDNDGLMDGIEDADANGLLDSTETDPNNPDTDGDDILDGDEDSNHNGSVDNGETDPLDPDTDDDSFIDSQDVFPLNAEEWADNDSDGTGDNADPDDDNDGMPDTYEENNGLNPLVNNAFDDSDNDGFSDFREFLSGSHPGNELDLPPLIADKDTDNDVDGDDFSSFVMEFGQTECSVSNPCDFDLDGDKDVDDIDLYLFTEDFGRVEN